MARRSWNTKLSLLLMMAVVLSLIIQVSVNHVSTQADSPEVTGINLPPVVSVKHSNPKMDSALSQLVEAASQGKAAHFAQQHGLYIESNKVRVILESKPDKIQDVILAVQAVSGNLEASYRNLIQVRVPISALNDIANSPYINFIQDPLTPTITETTIESMGLINATAWNGAGYDGTGISIGVLDMGFKNYSTLLGTDLPSSIADTWWSPTIGYNESEHGTACAEVIHDISPNASLYFATCSTSVEWGNAIDWLISKEVDIISCSLIWLNGGPGDGTGTICDAVSDAADADILWVNSAGNYAEGHWMGNWSDPDSSRMHNFSVNDESNAINVNLNLSSTIRLGLRWNDSWDTSSNDYDLILYNSSLSIVASSERVQDGSSWPPIEEISYTATYSGTYHIGIYNYSADGTSELHLFSFNQDLQYQNPEYSVLQPADSPNAMAVGAVDWSTPATIELYSSQGPTMDDRTKPDIVAPDWVSTTTNMGPWGFGGTSAAAPHVAGAAALVKQMYPLYTYTDLQSHLEFSAVDLGDAGKDNVFGSGRLYLDPTPPYPETTIDDILDYVEDLSSINGSASCIYAPISNVEIRINRSSDSYFWNGTGWQSGEIWIDTEAIDGAFNSATEPWTINGTTSPALPAAWTKGCTYNIAARAVDNASTTDQTPAIESFYVGKFSWDTMEIDNGDDFFGIWGSNASDIFVVGGDPVFETSVIGHYNGSSWDMTTNESGYVLRGIWGSSGSDIFSVGSSGTILHYDGSTWATMDSGSMDYLYGVWGSNGSDIFSVGSSGTILHYNGSTWNEMSSGCTDTLTGVWGNASNDIYAVGFNESTADGIVLHFNGSEWETLSGTWEILSGIWGSNSSDIFTAGYSGNVSHYNGSSWSNMISNTVNDLETVWGTSSSNVFIAGDTGTTLHYEGTYWIPMYSGTVNMINSIWGTASDVYAVGNKGTILHYKAYPDNSVYLTGPEIVEEGDDFTLTASLSTTGALYSGQIYIQYDPNIITVSNVEDGLLYATEPYALPITGGWSLNGSGEEEQGLLRMFFTLYEYGIPTGKREASANIEFHAVANGSTGLIFTPNSSLLDVYSSSISMNWYNSSITVYEPRPPQITDLSCSPINQSAIHLEWTATGSGGDGSEYDIRWRLNDPITEDNWGYSTTSRYAGAPMVPQAANASESLDITGLENNTFYYFAVKVSNPGTHFSDLSNICGNTTQGYALALTSSPPEGGNTSGSGTYSLNAIVNIDAAPNTCYYFSEWTGNTSALTGPATNASNSVIMSDHVSLTANFNIITYNLTTDSTAGGSVTSPGEAGPYTYNCSEVVNLIATPDSCYEFINWTGDTEGIADVNDPTTTITMNSNYSITANFNMVTYDLTTAHTGTGSTSGDGNFNCGSYADITATETDACWVFDHWTGSGITNASDPTTTVLIDGDKTVTAVFTQITYDLTTAHTGTGSASGDGNFNCGSYADITATETDACWLFDHWTGSGITDVNDPTTTVLIDGDKTVTAVFVQLTYDLTTAHTGTGSTSGDGNFNCGSYADITATETDACWLFDHWTGSGITDVNDPTTTVLIDGDKTVTAVFTQIGPFSLNISSSEYGNVTAPGEGGFGPYPCGTTLNLTATADTGCSFVNWTGDTESIDNPNAASTTILMNGNTTIQANFVLAPWDVNDDDHVNVLDMIRIGQHWGETGSPGWIPEDVNNDGTVNVLDMILIGQHWTG